MLQGVGYLPVNHRPQQIWSFSGQHAGAESGHFVHFDVMRNGLVPRQRSQGHLMQDCFPAGLLTVVTGEKCLNATLMSGHVQKFQRSFSIHR